MSSVIRGSGLNTGTFESGENVARAEVRLVAYRCPDGHITHKRFFANADEIRVQWDCAICRQPAFTDIPEAVPLPPPTRLPAQHKSHWQQLSERRSVEELEALLEERLALLRARIPDPRADLSMLHGATAPAPAGGPGAVETHGTDGDDESPLSDMDEVSA